jgi:RNA polymerase sigma-70 factor (ECF subfamily)
MEQKLNDIWIELSDYLKGFISKQVKGSYVAEDILQDVFLKVNSQIDALRDETKLTAWIFQITRNAINDHFRSQNKLKTAHLNIEVLDTEITENETRQLSYCVQSMLNTLPKKYKEAVRLSEIEGLSQKDLADQLGISYSGAKSRVQRGREKLKKQLLQCCIIAADKYGNVLDYKEKACPNRC